MPRDFTHLDETHRYIVEDHCANPRFADPIDAPDAVAELENPFCGDYARVELRVIDDALAGLCAIGTGCVITRSSASMMAEIVNGRGSEEVNERVGQFREMMRTPDDIAVPDALGDAEALAGVPKFPIRIKCALLPWVALEDALSQVADV